MKNFNFHFIEKRKIFYVLSCLILIAGLVSVLVQGMNLGIDFTGGTTMQMEVKKDMQVAEVREALKELKHGEALVQQLQNGDMQIKLSFMKQAEQQKLASDLSAKIGKVDILKTNAVGPTMGKEILTKGILALVIAMVLMMIYITLRFEWRFAVAGILALFHDVFITLSIFSIFQWEINSFFVAAILTIFGYSINDTIVVFDRIRENLGRVKRDSLSSTVNKSINTVLTRSLYTSISTLIPLLAVCIFGGDTTRLFVLAIIIGIISGTYSSVLVASPLWYDFSMASKKKRF